MFPTGAPKTLEAAPEPLEVEEPDFLPFGAGMPGPNVLGPNFGPLPDLHEEGDSEVGGEDSVHTRLGNSDEHGRRAAARDM